MAQNSEPSALRQYVNDMHALDKHILEALERQRDDERVKADPQARELIAQATALFQRHHDAMHSEAERLGGTVGSAVKEAITGVLGVFAGLYDKVRQDPVSRMLRDDYVAFNMASVSYTMLHTTALAFGDSPLANLTLQHLKELAPLIIRINEIVPNVVASELRDEPGANAAVAGQAVQNTQAAWRV
ncbi:MAG: hypothetical protein JO117_05115 [Verrucomicrobia bacterium]|nr:hypothetical protein [Verrucomicrobiota bacterium]